MFKNDSDYIEELRFRIAFYRKKNGMTQEEVAEKLGLKRSTYSTKEKKGKKFDEKFLNKLAEIFGESPNVFVIKHRLLEQNSSLYLQNEISVPTEVFTTTNKEQRIIKMLRLLPQDVFDDYYNKIRNDYESTMNDD